MIDESQGTFGLDVRGRVDKITQFETHRHHGWDVHIITQHPSLICQPVRKLVGKHINFIRPYGRTKGIFRHEYEMCIDRPEKRSNFQLSQESKIEYDKHYFGLYKSATVHTHKKITPKFVKIIPIIILMLLCGTGLFVWGMYYLMHSMDGEVPSEQTSTEVLPPATPGTKVEALPSRPVATDAPNDYAQQNTPRVADIAASAPRYDAVNKPRDFPRPMCISSTDPGFISTAKGRGIKVGYFEGQPVSCQCYTQQVTRMDTSIDFCMSVVRNGYFDDTQPQRQIATSNSRGMETKSRQDPSEEQRRGRAAAVPSAGRSPNEVQVTVITDSGLTARRGSM